MLSDGDTLESLKLRLKSVTKQKLSQEREVLKLRNKERKLMDELNMTKSEVEQLTEKLEAREVVDMWDVDTAVIVPILIVSANLLEEITILKTSDIHQQLKNQITQSKHQISMIDMCMVSEDLKIESHINVLNEHLGGFQQLFDRDQREIEQRIKEQREKEAKLQEDLRQKEKQIAEENQWQMREAAAIEEEAEVIERECAVLKKRNNAIMLKLRKRLLEAENTRREVMKRNTPQLSAANENEGN